MNGIFCYRSNKGIALLAKGSTQMLYTADDSIIAVEKPIYEISELLTKTKNKDIENYLNASQFRDLNFFLGIKNKDFTLKKHLSGQGYISNVDSFDYISDKRNTVDLRLASDMDNGFIFSSCRSLEDMLEYIYRISRDDAHNVQLGLIDRYDAKVLLSPKHEFHSPPVGYSRKGEIDKSMFKVNSEFYGLLLDTLENNYQFSKDMLRLLYDASFFKKQKKLIQIRRKKKDIADIITRFLDYEHGPIERFTVKNFIESYKDNSKKNPVPKVHNPDRLSLQQRLDSEFLPKDQKNMIIALNKKIHPKNLQQQVYGLEKELGMKVRPFSSVPYLSVKGDNKDIVRLHGMLSSNKYSMFSKKTSSLMRSAGNVVYSHGIYIPELINAFTGTGRGTIIPISVKNKNILWNLKNICSDRANEITDGSGINVAVVDTGADYNHHEIRLNFSRNKGYDFVDDNSDPMDRQYHGTHVCGTVAGSTTGVAPGCSLYAVRVLDERGVGWLDNILLGIDWCITNGMDVVNLSLGSPTDSYIEKDMFLRAYNAGLICAAAAGNDGWGPNYPAAYETVISVAAVDRFNEHADFSNIYFTNNVSAPGVGIHSIIPGEDYGELSGTSMAAPHISGAAALIASVQKVNKDSALEVIEKTALGLGDINDPGRWDMYGCGLVQADKAVGAQSQWKKKSA